MKTVKTEQKIRPLRPIGWVRQVTGLSNSTIHALYRQRVLPRPIKITESCHRWFEDEILAFIEQRDAARNEQEGQS